MIHSALTGESPVCPRGRQRKYGSLESGGRGFLYCGSRAKCECHHEAAGQSFITTMQGRAPAGYELILNGPKGTG